MCTFSCRGGKRDKDVVCWGLKAFAPRGNTKREAYIRVILSEDHQWVAFFRTHDALSTQNVCIWGILKMFIDELKNWQMAPLEKKIPSRCKQSEYFGGIKEMQEKGNTEFYEGTVYCTRDESWKQIKSNGEECIYDNACLQVLRTERLLRRLLPDYVLDNWSITPIVIFVHPKARILRAKGNHKPQTDIITLPLLEATFRKTNSLNSIRRVLKNGT